MPCSSASTGDVIRPGLGVNLWPLFARLWRDLERLERKADQLSVFEVLCFTKLLEGIAQHVTDLRLGAPSEDDWRHYLARARTTASIRSICSAAVPRMPSPRSSSA